MTQSFARVLVLLLSGMTVLSAARDNLTLAAKARLFDVDIVERFLHEGQLATRRRLPMPERPFVTYNMPDNAYMTGIYCAAQSWRFAATGEPEAARLARSAFLALNHLLEVSGRPGLLARAAVPIGRPWFDDGIWRESLDGRYRWRGNVSSDQVVGVIFGYYVYFARVADTADRALLAEKVRQLVGRILDDDLRIIGYDGKVTTWGHYEPSYVVNREPMNALLLLQMVKIAQVVTGDARFDREYRRLTDEGELNDARIAENARLDVPPLEANHSDDMLIALALYSLLELEQQPTIKPYLP